MISKKVLDQPKNFPKQSGVYIMRDKEYKIIYIGKAKSLKNRINNYFSGQDKRVTVEFLVNKVASLDYIITSKGDMMYNCPFCEEKRGKIDNDHKFGINCKSGLGFCFKCHTKVVTFKYNNSNSEKVIPFLFDYFNFCLWKVLSRSNFVFFYSVIKIELPLFLKNKSHN